MNPRPEYIDVDPADLDRIEDLYPDYDVCELKYDGWWCEVHIEGRRARIYAGDGRLMVEYTLDHDAGGPHVLLGEFMHGTPWSTQEGRTGKVRVHDCLVASGTDEGHKSQNYRSAGAGVVVSLLKDRRFQLTQRFPNTHTPWTHYVNGYEDFEGLVLKQSHAPYGAPWLRVKKVLTDDFIVMGFEQSKAPSKAGKAVKSVILGRGIGGTPRAVLAVSGGFRRKELVDMYANPDKYMGRIAEIKGNRREKSGALRHPRFLRWRDDKGINNV